MSQATITDDAGAAKANMDDIYVQSDPRAYFRELGVLGYGIPDQAKPIFRMLIDRIAATRAEPVTALDLGCSYGINGALLKYDLSMAELRAHWVDPAVVAAPTEQVVADDRAFFKDAGEDPVLRLIGLDASEPAIRYAERSGLLDWGIADNLEQVPLPERYVEPLGEVDLVISTGCIGYVTETTFAKLLPVVTQGGAPWIANFVLRMFPFDTIAATLDEAGYVTEKLAERSFVQREFASRDERDKVIGEIEALGLDPTGLEAEGALHAEFFLSRPRDQAGLAIDELIAG